MGSLPDMNFGSMVRFGRFNLAAYWNRKYKNKVEKEPWYLLTNLDSLDEVLIIPLKYSCNIFVARNVSCNIFMERNMSDTVRLKLLYVNAFILK